MSKRHLLLFVVILSTLSLPSWAKVNKRLTTLEARVSSRDTPDLSHFDYSLAQASDQIYADRFRNSLVTIPVPGFQNKLQQVVKSIYQFGFTNQSCSKFVVKHAVTAANRGVAVLHWLEQNVVVVAFQGSSSEDLRLNVTKATLARCPLDECGSLHEGVKDMFEAIPDNVMAETIKHAKEQGVRHIAVTGHSTGGSLAQLFGLRLIRNLRESTEHRDLQRQITSVHVATFGSPRVFDSAFARAFQSAKSSTSTPGLSSVSYGARHESSLCLIVFKCFEKIVDDVVIDEFKPTDQLGWTQPDEYSWLTGTKETAVELHATTQYTRALQEKYDGGKCADTHLE